VDGKCENRNRILFDLSTALTTKFFRKYPALIHIIEPSVEYEYVPAVDNDGIPFFDSIDSISQTSRINYSINNRITGLSSNNLEAGFRLSQSYNMLDIDREFTPVLAEAVLSSGMPLLPSDDGYFAYVPCDAAQEIAERAAEDFLYVIPMNGGVRVGLCSIPDDEVERAAEVLINAWRTVTG